MFEGQFYCNGIDGSTGEYLLPPLTSQQISHVAQGESFDPPHLSELKSKNRQVKGLDPDFAPVEGIDPKNLDETGWGIIFAFDPEFGGPNPAIREALLELLEYRKKQATQNNSKFYQEYTYRLGESKGKFLARHGVGPGPVNPKKMPYYLLIVGDPNTIPYNFQYQLDVQYAVGRIYFHEISDYKQYAHSVVEAETKTLKRRRCVTFFGVRNNDDKATQLSAEHLIQPLAETTARAHLTWDVRALLPHRTTKLRLGQLLGGSETPALLFTASHGLGFQNGDSRQLSKQGALICQDWPGPLQSPGKNGIPDDYYFCADDVSEEARLLGLIIFNFACYSAGTPQMDEFSHRDPTNQRETIAHQAFVACLPQRLLSHQNGGALAVIGHVDRAWGCSFVWEEAGEQLAVFQSTLKRLLDGHPVGSAVEYFNERYAELSSDLSTELEDIKFGKIADDISLANMWTANNDARSYAIVGDPAVRLMVDIAAE